jgi:hypothetical protein
VTTFAAPGRQPRLAQQAAEVHGRARGQLARLDRRGAPDGQRERKLLADDQQREVPGRDHRHHADRLVQDEPEDVGAERAVRVAVGVAGQRGGVLPQLGGRLDLAVGLGDRLAALERLDPRQLLGVATHELGDAEQDPGALDARHPRPRPLVEGAARGADRSVDVGRACLRIARDDDVVGRARAREAVPVEGLDVVAVDEHQPFGG